VDLNTNMALMTISPSGPHAPVKKTASQQNRNAKEKYEQMT
jgi:hypothetical protein